MEKSTGKSWVFHIEVIGFFIAMLTLFLNLSSKIDEHNNQLTSSIQQVNTRMETCMQQFSVRMDQSGERTDKLYQMFVDLVKENDRHRREMDIREQRMEWRLDTACQNTTMLMQKVQEWHQDHLNHQKKS